MANRRSNVIAEPVGPSFLPGMDVYTDTVTLTDAKVLTITFPAKTIVSVIKSVFGDVATTESVAAAASVTGNVGTVTFTATSASAVKFSYIIVASQTETIAANTLTVDTSETPVQ